MQSQGQGNSTLTLNIEANLETKQRTALVSIKSAGTQKFIIVTQQPGSGAEYHYKLPIIFHFIESPTEAADKKLKKGYMAEVMGHVNKFYKDKINSVDMALEFVLATHDPQGKELAEPGENRITYTGTFPVDAVYLMRKENNDFKKMLWNSNEYINVFIAPLSSNTNSLGIAHIAMTPKSHHLEGTNTSSASYLTLDNIKLTFCVTLNRNYAHKRSTANKYDADDFVVTTAHELAHHLGLHHTFTEGSDNCTDTDYCLDTPSYNREAYEAWLDDFTTDIPPTPSQFREMFFRTDCAGKKFESRNIMDYYYSWGDGFTDDQRDRIRHVLTYGMLLPGPKIRDQYSTQTKAIEHNEEIRSIE